jgi:hypothetical protein
MQSAEPPDGIGFVPLTLSYRARGLRANASHMLQGCIRGHRFAATRV